MSSAEFCWDICLPHPFYNGSEGSLFRVLCCSDLALSVPVVQACVQALVFTEYLLRARLCNRCLGKWKEKSSLCPHRTSQLEREGVFFGNSSTTVRDRREVLHSGLHLSFGEIDYIHEEGPKGSFCPGPRTEALIINAYLLSSRYRSLPDDYEWHF